MTISGVVAVFLYNITLFQPLLFVAYFPIWWAGAEVGRAVARQTEVPVARIAVSVGLLSLAFGGFVLLGLFNGLRPASGTFGIHPFLEFRHAVGTFVIIIVLTVYARTLAPRLNILMMPFTVLAPISYGMYVLHVPIMNSSVVLALPLAIRIPVAIGAVLAAAWFAEVPYQRFVLKISKQVMNAFAEREKWWREFELWGTMVLRERIELSTSPLPMECSTTELPQRAWMGTGRASLSGALVPQAPACGKRFGNERTGNA